MVEMRWILWKMIIFLRWMNVVKNQETFDTLRFLFQTSNGGGGCTLGKWLLLHEKSS
jgi:hypothetical protein